MVNIYEHDDFRDFLKKWLQKQPKAGRGLLSSWAEKLNLHPTLLSQVLSAKKELSLETADQLGGLLGLSEGELEYFLLLVQYSRAGSVSLRKLWLKKIKESQEKSKILSERLKNTQQLSDLAKAEFYSSWVYSGIRNLTALKNMKSSEAIAQHLSLPRETVQKVVEFLLETGLCVLTPEGLDVGPQRTHIPMNSPLVKKHHQNWRLEGFQKMLLQKEQDLFFTFPMSLSEKDAHKIRALLPKWIEDVHGIVGPSPSETVRCLNIDFFEY